MIWKKPNLRIGFMLHIKWSVFFVSNKTLSKLPAVYIHCNMQCKAEICTDPASVSIKQSLTPLAPTWIVKMSMKQMAMCFMCMST